MWPNLGASLEIGVISCSGVDVSVSWPGLGLESSQGQGVFPFGSGSFTFRTREGSRGPL